MPDFRSAVKFNKIPVVGLVFENLASAPSSPIEGQSYYDTALHVGRVWNGTAWRNMDGTSLTLDTVPVAVADVSVGNHKITNLADPISAQDAVNYRTLTAAISGISSRAEVVYATAAALPTNTYANGTSGVGATLTATANAALSVDGQAVVSGQRILVKNEGTTSHNGIYTVSATGGAGAPYVLTRAADSDEAAENGAGILVPVEAPTGVTGGTVNNGTVWISLGASPFVVGTSSLTYSQVGQTYTADGTTIQLSGTQFSLVSPVTVAHGGTGSTTAAGARTNLSAAGVYSTDIGDGATNPITVNHALGQTYPDVAIYEKSTGKKVEADVVSVDANNVTVSFAVTATAAQYRATVTG